ncbi:hypothetical protein GOP47_0009754 [Adiantum capillus-veneris]|uniref:Uncharacterized protein n=1 Tax=Adiantum capillus-veneris TaxID=13818 RepID=A0A9D4UY26_ADICA|nr:hypothetical protein GOP47_0009754 [Adiantum capillus-veneris]
MLEEEEQESEEFLMNAKVEPDRARMPNERCCGRGESSNLFQCDCTECVSIEGVKEGDNVPGAMVVTRSSGKVKGDKVQKKEEQQPIDWKVQDQIRMGVLKEINKVNKRQEDKRRETQEVPEAIVRYPADRIQEGVGKGHDQALTVQKKAAVKMSEEFFDALMEAPTQISLRQILSLVPSFADQFMQKLQQQYGGKNPIDLQTDEDPDQEIEVEKLKKKLGKRKLFPEGSDLEAEQKQAASEKNQKMEEKLKMFQGHLHRRESNAKMYKVWQNEWKAVLTMELGNLAKTNVALEADNKVLLNRVAACKDVEKQIRECTDDELSIDGWYLSPEEVEDMKAQLRKQGEQIWQNLGVRLEEVMSKPYEIFAKEENKEEYELLKFQYEELHEKYNALLEQQSQDSKQIEKEGVQEDDVLKIPMLDTLVDTIAQHVKKDNQELEKFSEEIADQGQNSVVAEKEKIVPETNLMQQAQINEEENLQQLIVDDQGDTELQNVEDKVEEMLTQEDGVLEVEQKE